MGRVLASMGKQVSLPNSVTAVEAIAISRAVTFAKEIGLNSIVLDEDLAVIIDSLKNDEIFVADYSHLIEKAKDIAGFFAICGFSLIKKQDNCIARYIAEYVSNFKMWMKYIPPHLNDVILADLASF